MCKAIPSKCYFSKWYQYPTGHARKHTLKSPRVRKYKAKKSFSLIILKSAKKINHMKSQTATDGTCLKRHRYNIWKFY